MDSPRVGGDGAMSDSVVLDMDQYDTDVLSEFAGRVVTTLLRGSYGRFATCAMSEKAQTAFRRFAMSGRSSTLLVHKMILTAGDSSPPGPQGGAPCRGGRFSSPSAGNRDQIGSRTRSRTTRDTHCWISSGRTYSDEERRGLLAIGGSSVGDDTMTMPGYGDGNEDDVVLVQMGEEGEEEEEQGGGGGNNNNNDDDNRDEDAVVVGDDDDDDHGGGGDDDHEGKARDNDVVGERGFSSHCCGRNREEVLTCDSLDEWHGDRNRFDAGASSRGNAEEESYEFDLQFTFSSRIIGSVVFIKRGSVLNMSVPIQTQLHIITLPRERVVETVYTYLNQALTPYLIALESARTADVCGALDSKLGKQQLAASMADLNENRGAYAVSTCAFLAYLALLACIALLCFIASLPPPIPPTDQPPHANEGLARGIVGITSATAAALSSCTQEPSPVTHHSPLRPPLEPPLDTDARYPSQVPPTGRQTVDTPSRGAVHAALDAIVLILAMLQNAIICDMAVWACQSELVLLAPARRAATLMYLTIGYASLALALSAGGIIAVYWSS
ncbi:hypothetical protein CBR_g12656 [Chara braunii]|uniref:Uncharacterized protein n=1 Tax=Chara braunii TaxID=69332 RepID=A0A388KSA0_CHABU|nr:hypothetical protein CBR_g12656 [Chara braunii]|eukprot:GBG72934.1 hypothetical protein CBR_g12656 [Chara braunii]